MRIVFFGTSAFAAQVFECLFRAKHEIVAVVTRVDKPRGRHLHSAFPPVKERVLCLCPSLPLFQPEKASAPAFVDLLQTLQADLFVVVAYGEIIKKTVLDLPKLGCINLHASLLPKFRGAAPMQRCLMAGDEKTGVTIIEMTPEMDAGDILAMQETPVSQDMTFGELEKVLCELGSQLLLKVLAQFEVGAMEKHAQESSQVTLAPKISSQDERIDWKRSAQEIHNQIRALSPFPGAWTTLHIGGVEKRLKIKRSQPLPQSVDMQPGKAVLFDQNNWRVACREGVLELLEVQLEGKRVMRVEEFLRGFSFSKPCASYPLCI